MPASEEGLPTTENAGGVNGAAVTETETIEGEQQTVEGTEVASPDENEGTSEVEALRRQVAKLTQEKAAWEEERARLIEENGILRSRCQKLAVAAASATPPSSKNLPPELEQMLRNPKDEAVQLQGIEALFAKHTRVEGDDQGAITSGAPLQASLEAAVAIFSNHPRSQTLLLKASQFLSVLLDEPSVQQQLPAALLFEAGKEVVAAGGQLLADEAMQARGSSASTASKLMTWMLSLVAHLLPCLSAHLQDKASSEQFVHDLLSRLVNPLLASAELPQEALTLKCAQLMPLMPQEAWVQKAALESGAVHSLALALHRCAGGPTAAEATLQIAVRAAVRWLFSRNVELSVQALADNFVSDEFVCSEVLDELLCSEKKHRGTFLVLDSEWGIIGKVLGLWGFHQRRALEDACPEKSTSREVLHRSAKLLSAVLLKLPARVVLQRMQEFQDAEVLQRVALSVIHGSPQLRLQMAVNYVENEVGSVVIGCMHLLLRRHEDGATGTDEVEAAFRLLQDDKLPSDSWPYVLYCLEVCIHVLSHWNATKISLAQKADVLDARAAPLLLAQGGLVDVLAEIVDPVAAGFELRSKPPQAVQQKATETLQALFEQNGHICLFCIQHYTEVRQMVALGCDSIAQDPLAEFPEMQQQAVAQLAASFEKFAVQDEKLGRKILKALAVLFESSYRLVAWFLKQHALANVGELQSLDVHVEAVRAVARAPYWSSEDSALLPEFVTLIARLLLDSVEGLGEAAAPPAQGRRVLDLTEAEEVASACISTLMHLLLIDPSPPTVLMHLTATLGHEDPSSADGETTTSTSSPSTSERAVGAVMRVMQVFPSSDRVHLNCQHLLTSLLGE